MSAASKSCGLDLLYILTTSIPVYDYSSVSQGLSYAPPVTLTTHGSVLPVPGNDNDAFVSKAVMTTL